MKKKEIKQKFNELVKAIKDNEKPESACCRAGVEDRGYLKSFCKKCGKQTLVLNSNYSPRTDNRL